jgi:hypothetical protein
MLPALRLEISGNHARFNDRDGIGEISPLIRFMRASERVPSMPGHNPYVHPTSRRDWIAREANRSSLLTCALDLAKTTTSGRWFANHLSPPWACNSAASSDTAFAPNNRRNLSASFNFFSCSCS